MEVLCFLSFWAKEITCITKIKKNDVFKLFSIASEDFLLHLFICLSDITFNLNNGINSTVINRLFIFFYVYCKTLKIREDFVFA